MQLDLIEVPANQPRKDNPPGSRPCNTTTTNQHQVLLKRKKKSQQRVKNHFEVNKNFLNLSCKTSKIYFHINVSGQRNEMEEIKRKYKLVSWDAPTPQNLIWRTCAIHHLLVYF